MGFHRKSRVDQTDDSRPDKMVVPGTEPGELPHAPGPYESRMLSKIPLVKEESTESGLRPLHGGNGRCRSHDFPMSFLRRIKKRTVLASP